MKSQMPYSMALRRVARQYRNIRIWQICFIGIFFDEWALPTPKSGWRIGSGRYLQPLEVDALADTGALFLCIPRDVQIQLQLEETSQKEVTTADGRRSLCPYVGPVRVRFENRECYVGAVVLGDDVLLGAVPMEDMDLVVMPSARRLAVNPLHPNFAAGPAKGLP